MGIPVLIIRNRAYIFSLLMLIALGCQKTQRAADGTKTISQDTLSQIPVRDSTIQSAVTFTQNFYDWYHLHNDNMMTAIDQRPELFETELLKGLKDDIEKQSKNPEEIVGIDYDPFTMSQDPCDPYRVENASQRGDTIIVAMKGMCTDVAPRSYPDVLVKLRRKISGWVFVDFISFHEAFSLLDDLAKVQKRK
jgi:hypothetical protein